MEPTYLAKIDECFDGSEDRNNGDLVTGADRDGAHQGHGVSIPLHQASVDLLELRTQWCRCCQRLEIDSACPLASPQP